MKIKVLSFALLLAAVTFTACNTKKETTETTTEEVVDTTATATAPVADTTATEVATPAAATQYKDGEVIEVTGKVTEIIQGKDGYMAKITAADNKLYTATISIPNLDNPKQFRASKVGDNITVKGEVTNLESDVLIRVKELK